MPSVSSPGDVREPIVVREYGLPFLDVVVLGAPRPQGSKKAWAFIPKEGGKPKARMSEDAEGHADWRRLVRDDVRAALPGRREPVDGPIRVDLVFCLRKPSSAPVRRRTWPHRKPDVDKLTRAVFDSLTDAGAWRDDSRAVELHVYKDYPGEGKCRDMDVPGVHIRMWRMPDEVYVRESPPPVKDPGVPGTVPLPGL